MSDPNDADDVQVNCARCGNNIWVARTGTTTCRCGVRHHMPTGTQEA